MRLHQRSISKVTLLSLLKRRKSDLKRFLSDTGIVTYELLKSRCDSMGVIQPEEKDFINASGADSAGMALVSSPTEGLIVLDPPKIINELTGKEVEMPDINPLLKEELPIIAEELITDTAQEHEHFKKKKKN
jgi:hypothetical protein